MAKSDLDRAATGTVVEDATSLWPVLSNSSLELVPTLLREEDGTGIAPQAPSSLSDPSAYRRPPPAYLSLFG